jgi:hypothetical protein
MNFSKKNYDKILIYSYHHKNIFIFSQNTKYDVQQILVE